MAHALCLTCHTGDRRRATYGNLCFRCHGKLLGYLTTLESALISLGKTRGEKIGNAPGFGSSPPLNLEALAVLDYRSRPHDEIKLNEHGVWMLNDDNQPIPDGAINTDAHAILGTLHNITQSIAEERGRQWPARITVLTECGYIRGHLAWLCEQDWVDDLADELRELANLVKRVSGERTAKAVGRCTTLLKRGECGTKLYAPLDGDRIKCRACGREWPREEWLRLGRLLTSS